MLFVASQSSVLIETIFVMMTQVYLKPCPERTQCQDADGRGPTDPGGKYVTEQLQLWQQHLLMC